MLRQFKAPQVSETGHEKRTHSIALAQPRKGETYPLLPLAAIVLPPFYSSFLPPQEVSIEPFLPEYYCRSSTVGVSTSHILLASLCRAALWTKDKTVAGATSVKKAAQERDWTREKGYAASAGSAAKTCDDLYAEHVSAGCCTLGKYVVALARSPPRS